MSDPKPNDIILTLTISPAVNGKRKVIISGAPEKEMPTVRVGTFADLHRLLDEVWVELQKRKPQVVTVKAEKATVKSGAKSDDADADGETQPETTDDQLDASDDPSTAAQDDDAPDPVEKAFDDAGGNRIAEVPDGADEPLPVIEGDTQNE